MSDAFITHGTGTDWETTHSLDEPCDLCRASPNKYETFRESFDGMVVTTPADLMRPEFLIGSETRDDGTTVSYYAEPGTWRFIEAGKLDLDVVMFDDPPPPSRPPKWRPLRRWRFDAATMRRRRAISRYGVDIMDVHDG